MRETGSVCVRERKPERLSSSVFVRERGSVSVREGEGEPV